MNNLSEIQCKLAHFKLKEAGLMTEQRFLFQFFFKTEVRCKLVDQLLRCYKRFINVKTSKWVSVHIIGKVFKPPL
jgi:hypothetical protein